MLVMMLLLSVTLFLLAGAIALGYIDARPLFGADQILKPEFLAVFMLVMSIPMTFSVFKLKERARERRRWIRRGPPPDYDAAEAKLAEIEAEMKRIGFWQTEPLPPDKYDFERAFGGDTMAFSQWIQFVLIPRVRELIETRGAFPPESQVAVQAVREFDGLPETERLQSLLREFDMLFGPYRL